MLQKHPPWVGIRFHLGSGFTAIRLPFYPQHFFFIACPQTFAFVVSCHPARLPVQFQKLLFSFHSGGQTQTSQPGITKTMSTGTHLARPPQRQIVFNGMFLM